MSGGVIRETIQPARKDSGMETMPGEDSGNSAQSAFGNIEVSVPDTAGEKKMRSKQER